MSFLVDTDIISAFLKGNRQVANRFLQYGGRLHMSVATLAELSTWTNRSGASQKRKQGLEDILQSFVVLEATAAVARKFGETEAALLDCGLAITEFDLLIAATALVHDLILVTHNVGDFQIVPRLTILDWMEL